MNEKGNVVLFLILGFVLIALIPPILMHVFPPAGLLFQIMMIFIIYSMVRGYMGTGAISIVITAVLVYFMVFKYRDLFATLWVFQLLLSVQWMSVVIWGIGTRLKSPGQ